MNPCEPSLLPDFMQVRLSGGHQPIATLTDAHAQDSQHDVPEHLGGRLRAVLRRCGVHNHLVKGA